MLCIEANIRLYKDRLKVFIEDGYHPVFDFIPGSPELKAGGKIYLLDRDELAPGETCRAEIWFPGVNSLDDDLTREYFGTDFRVGKNFTFSEGGEPIGEGEVLHIR